MRKAGLVTIAPVRHTCIMSASASTFDFFLASHEIARVVEKVRFLAVARGASHACRTAPSS
eukprot:4613276-Pyramimonas_sp.AAC.1